MNQSAQGSEVPKELTSDIRGSNQSGMRAHNERLVLSLVRRHGALAKSEIARMTGLSAQTVSVIMRALEEDGLLVRGEPVRGRVGQPSVPIRLAPDGAFFFGLKIGRRSADLILIDFLGNVRDRASITYKYPTPDAMISFATAAFARLIGAMSEADRPRVSGLGIAIPFQLWDWAGPLGVPESEMATWRNRDIRAELETSLLLPVYLENDASSACGAELVFGTQEHPADFLYFYVGYFIGGGLVLNGRLFAGPTGNAGALGSMPVPVGGGRIGQLIEVASLQTLARALHAKGIETASMWDKPEGWPNDAETLADWVDQAGSGIAYCIASATCVADLGTVLIDGWMPRQTRDMLIQSARRHLKAINLSGIAVPTIAAGTVGPDSRALGAASLPLSERYLTDSAG